jgi:hypothetical protein
LLIDDIVEREFGDLYADVQRIVHVRQLVELTVDLRTLEQPGQEFAPYDVTVLAAAREVVAKRVRVLNAELNEVLFPKFDRWTEAYVRVAALLEDLDVVAAHLHHDDLARDVGVLRGRLLELDPTRAPWLPYPATPERAEVIGERIDQARAARQVDRAARAGERPRTWTSEVLAAAGYRGRPIWTG